MNINKTNYGAWFIDYFDGNLSAEKTAELFLFLEQHQDLKQEFESFRSVTLEPSDVIYIDKDKLKKTGITAATVEEFIIADLENDLNLQDKIKLKEFIAENPSYKKEQDLFRLTRLQPEAEVFPDKKSLKKKIITPVLIQMRVITAVAAAIIIMLGLLYINRQQDQEQTAEKTPQKNTLINDSLKDFFNNADEIKTEIQKNNLAEKKFPEINSDEKNNKVINQTASTSTEKFIAPAPEKLRNTDPVQLAERKEIHLINVSYDATTESAPVLFAGRTVINNEKETVKEKFDDIKDLAVEKVNQLTGEELLYTSEIASDPATDKLPLKSRLFKFTAWALNKISNNKVQLENTFDQSGNIAAYQVSAGKFKYEKEF